ncbi:hypothetical protein IAT38_002671 [Cryptococcus sp. DSM 104549]
MSEDTKRSNESTSNVSSGKGRWRKHRQLTMNSGRFQVRRRQSDLQNMVDSLFDDDEDDERNDQPVNGKVKIDGEVADFTFIPRKPGRVDSAATTASSVSASTSIDESVAEKSSSNSQNVSSVQTQPSVAEEEEEPGEGGRK